MQVATSDVELWPEDENVVPLWRLEQERRAMERGYTLPRYRTKQAFRAQVELCVERLERNVELELQAEQRVPAVPRAPFKSGTHRFQRNVKPNLPPVPKRPLERSKRKSWALAWIAEFQKLNNGEMPRWMDVHHGLKLTKATASRYLRDAKRIHRATIPERLAA